MAAEKRQTKAKPSAVTIEPAPLPTPTEHVHADERAHASERVHAIERVHATERVHTTERVHATEEEVKRAASLAVRVHELAHFVAGQVASWSRLGEAAPGETQRAIADLEASLETLGHGREMDGGDGLLSVVRDVIQLVRRGNLVRGAVMLVADATRRTNESLARQIVDARDAIIAIVDKVIFFQLPPEEMRELVQDLAVRMRMLESPPRKAREPRQAGDARDTRDARDARDANEVREVPVTASVAGRRRPKGRKTAKSRRG